MAILNGWPSIQAVSSSRSEHSTWHSTHLHLALIGAVAAHTRRCGGRQTQGPGPARHLVVGTDAQGTRPAPQGRARTVACRPDRVRASSIRRQPAVLARSRAVALVVAAGRRPIDAPSPVHAVVGDVVTRTTRRYQRVEGSVGDRRVTRDRVDVAAEVARVLTASETAAETAASHPAAASPWAPTPSHHTEAAGIDLEGLTDQIVTRLDDRLTAHRERVGRAF
jgi:hypothetical protein